MTEVTQIFPLPFEGRNANRWIEWSLAENRGHNFLYAGSAGFLASTC